MSKRINSEKIASTEITPEGVYYSRREFLKTMGVVSTAAILSACGVKTSSKVTSGQEAAVSKSAFTDERGDLANTFDEITHYNNYYEFSTEKEAVAELAAGLTTNPWAIEVGGMVHNPKTFGLEDLLKFPQEERVYRLRCVEAWSMVIPWTGFELNHLLEAVEPQASAKYVRFVSLYRPEEMPGQEIPLYPWPYNEGLRLDEAMHPLTILATGLYGKPMPNQNGAPVRLVVPWKYGFKSIKAIVKIELTDQQPATLWSSIAPHEYGFYANVNPEVDHPRWSQRSERRIGELSRRATLMFNGYADEVASLYANMDLKVNY